MNGWSDNDYDNDRDDDDDREQVWENYITENKNEWNKKPVR